MSDDAMSMPRLSSRLIPKVPPGHVFDPLPLYYEAHVTLEPVFDRKAEDLQEIAQRHGFRVAELLLQRRAVETATRSTKDAFTTRRGADYTILRDEAEAFAMDLTEHGLVVWRVKVEAALYDKRRNAAEQPALHQGERFR